MDRRLARGASLAVAALVAAPVLTLLPGFVPSAPFVVDLPGFQCRASPASLLSRDSPRIVCYAGQAERPGGPPVLDGAPEGIQKDVVLTRGQETQPMQAARVARQTRWLKSLKGKFTPIGPKPWETHRFSKAVLDIPLESKQASNTKILNQCLEELRRISGMHPRVRKANRNDARYGVRKGFPAGAAVAIYGPRMYDFLNRLNTIILPRVRDFEGLSPNSVDLYGNLRIKFANQEPFKELDELMDNREIVHGFDVSIVTSCITQADGLELLKKFGFPFRDVKLRRSKPRAKEDPKFARRLKKMAKKNG